jgi:hypothetical protein
MAVASNDPKLVLAMSEQIRAPQVPSLGLVM